MKLFYWLFSWFRRSPLERLDTYHPGERNIYHYWDGMKTTHADPLVLYKRVLAIGPELSIDLKVSHSLSKDAQKAHAAVMNKLRGIFDVTPPKNPLDAEGTLTENELLDLFNHFMLYTEEVKKNSRISLTSPMGASPLSGPSTEESPSISNTSASGSTAEGPSSAGSVPSPSGPASPSGPSIPEANTTTP